MVSTTQAATVPEVSDIRAIFASSVEIAVRLMSQEFDFLAADFVDNMEEFLKFSHLISDSLPE